MSTLRSGSATDVGRVRRVNQDRALEAGWLFAVADGMGGHVGGEVAARTAVQALEGGIGSVPSQERSAEALVEAIQEANLAVWEQARADPQLRGMGTTLTTVALVEEDGEEYLVVANVGDSRVYLLSEDEMTQLTADHSLVEDMVRSGELSTEEAASHPKRHILTRALGIEPDVEVDAWKMRPRAGDRLLLCSDGLVNEVDDLQIAEVLARLPDPVETAKELVTMARDHGGSDNITVVVVDVAPDGDGPDGDGPGSAVEEQEPAEAPTSVVSPRARSKAGNASRRPGPGAATALRDPLPGPPPGRDPLPGPPPGRAPLPGPPPGRAPLPGPPPGRRRRRVMTFRVVAFLSLLTMIVVAIAASVGWYARSSYYVGVAGSQVVIYQGRPGGLLWYKPQVAVRTGMATAAVPPSRLATIRAGMDEPSLDAARRYVANLGQEARSLSAAANALGATQTTVAQVPGLG